MLCGLDMKYWKARQLEIPVQSPKNVIHKKRQKQQVLATM